MAYRVTAPYVTVKTRTHEGERIIGLYAGGLLPADVPDEQIQHHLDNDMIVEVDEPPLALDEQPQLPDGDGGPQVEAPAKNASKADWVDYAVAQGAPRAEAEKASRDDLAAQFGAN